MDQPIDEPREVEEGVSYRETDAPGNAKHGFVKSFGGDTPLGAEKGNRAATDLPPQRPLTGGGPWGTLKKGR